MIRGYKIRIYPTKEQEELLWKHIGCSRFIWNYMLALQEERFKNGEKHLSHFDMTKLLTPLKKTEKYSWLNEVSNATLCRSCADLAEAYQRMFKKIAKHPKFKSKKRAKPSYPVRQNSMWFDEKYVHVEKIGKIKYKTDFTLSFGKGNKFSNPRIKNVLGKWILSFGIECENQAPELTDKSMGIDVGIKDTMIVAYGDDKIVFKNINKSKKVKELKRRIKHTQRNISRNMKPIELAIFITKQIIFLKKNTSLKSYMQN